MLDETTSGLKLPKSQANGEDAAPVPLSFPAILRNPGVSDRYAHLRPTKERPLDVGAGTKVNLKKGRRHDNEGKRWIRRKENGSSIFIHIIEKKKDAHIAITYQQNF
jgi:hypothetical protein